MRAWTPSRRAGFAIKSQHSEADGRLRSINWNGQDSVSATARSTCPNLFHHHGLEWDGFGDECQSVLATCAFCATGFTGSATADRANDRGEGWHKIKGKALCSVCLSAVYLSHRQPPPHAHPSNPLLIHLPACFDHQSGARCVFIRDITENEYEVQSGKHAMGETFPLRNEQVLCLFMRMVVCRDCRIVWSARRVGQAPVVITGRWNQNSL